MSTLIDETHDSARTSWVEAANGHADFPIQNLPIGIFSNGGAPRGGTAIGDFILDLAALAESGLLNGDAQRAAEAASGPALNALLALGAGPRRALRRRVSNLLSDPAHRAAVEPMISAAKGCTMHLPAAIGDYTDFYAGIHHATNVGQLFRPDNPLLPNYRYVPIGYHGRASSVRVSGADVVRPTGQRKAPTDDAPSFGPSMRLDYEVEIGVWIGPGNALGAPIPIGAATEHLAGLCLLNDWSARDVQTWEYQPLGPFLAKSFLTTISPWIVTAEALAPFRIAQPPRLEVDAKPLPYLSDADDQNSGAFAICLEASLSTSSMRAQGSAPLRLSRSAASDLYWTMGQLITHHSSNGCNLRAGDLLGTGTISSADKSGWGSLLEISRGGKEPLILPNGEQRTFLADGDELRLSGRAHGDGYVSIGFGDCRGTVRSGR